MSNKFAKVYRKEARKIAEKELQVLDSILKPKPRLFPRWLWKLLGKLFFNIKILQ